MAQRNFLKPFGAPQFYFQRRPVWGAPGAPILFFFPISFTAAQGGGLPNGRPRHPKSGAGGQEISRRRRVFRESIPDIGVERNNSEKFPFLF